MTGPITFADNNIASVDSQFNVAGAIVVNATNDADFSEDYSNRSALTAIDHGSYDAVLKIVSIGNSRSKLLSLANKVSHPLEIRSEHLNDNYQVLINPLDPDVTHKITFEHGITTFNKKGRSDSGAVSIDISSEIINSVRIGPNIRFYNKEQADNSTLGIRLRYDRANNRLYLEKASNPNMGIDTHNSVWTPMQWDNNQGCFL
jgi:hypothetical protein